MGERAMGAAAQDGGEFTRLTTLAEAKRRPQPLILKASAEDCAALARRFALVALHRLEAKLTLAVDGATLVVSGTVSADVEQACVATARPIPAHISEAVEVRFVPNAALEAAEAEAEIELDGAALDVIGYDGGGAIDLGAMVADTLALALNPYPRSADADAWLQAHGVQSEAEAGAFGALAALRDKLSQ